MTKVRWRTEDDGTCEILATGHATGSEQVCAGISAIIYSLAGWLKNSDCEVQELTLEKDLTKLVAHFAKDGDPTVLYAAPEAKGFGDGVDWDNAGSLVTVYERGTNSQGKCILKLKKGCYRPQRNMEVIDNMEIIGGQGHGRGTRPREQPDDSARFCQLPVEC